MFCLISDSASNEVRTKLCTSPGDEKKYILYFAILHNLHIVICIYAHGPYGLITYIKYRGFAICIATPFVVNSHVIWNN